MAAVGPCAETIRLWLLRVGLFLLRRPLPRCSDWVFLVDLTIQLGEHKCLVILGVRLSVLRSKGYSPAHHDVQVLSVAVLTRCNGETVAAHLGTLSKRLGVPVQVVSDHGSDVLAGIRSWKRTQQDHQRVVETYDITHGLAILLKNQLEPDARWASFVQACQSTRQQLQQTAGSFLKPPAWRSKPRFLNLESHLKWAKDMLVLLQGRRGGDFGGATWCWRSRGGYMVGRETGLAASVRVRSGGVELLSEGGQSCRERDQRRRTEPHELATSSRTAWKEKANLWEAEKAFREQVLSFVRKEGAKVPARQKYLGSTDVLESLFGKYKDLAAQAPCREITANVLMIPLLVTSLTADLLRQALETVRAQDVEEWLDEHLGPSPQKKKRAVLTAARSSNTNEGPEPA